MARATSANASQHRRARGTKAGIDLVMILLAAQTIAPDTLTMQAVADELGVDRKAVNHYVSDRDTLLELVATDAFTARFASVRIPDGDWREACRAFAFGVADSAIAAGPLAARLRMSGSLLAILLESVDAVMKAFVEAGFDDEAAARSIALLADIAVTHARDVVETRRSGEGMRHTWLRAALNERSDEEFLYADRLAASSIDTYDRRQLEYSIEVFLRGTEPLSTKRPSGRP